MEGLVWSHGDFTAVGPEFMSFHEFGSAISVVIILASLAHVFPPPSLQLDSQRLPWFLIADLCIWFHQLLHEGSWLTVGLLPSVITGEGQFRHPVHYC